MRSARVAWVVVDVCDECAETCRCAECGKCRSDGELACDVSGVYDDDCI